MSEHYETSWFCDKLCSHRRNIDSALTAANSTIDDLSGQLLALQKEIDEYKISIEYLRNTNKISFDNNMNLVSELVDVQKERDSLKAALDVTMKVYKENK